MPVVVEHAIPVRWRNPGARREGHALMRARTPVEVPLAPMLADPVASYAFESRYGRAAGFVHQGGAWRLATLADLDADAPDARRAATPEDLARALSAGAGRPGRAILPGSPLNVGERHARGRDVRGTDLPGRVLARAVGDVESLVREAVALYVGRTFRVMGPMVLVPGPRAVVRPFLGPRRVGDLAPAEIGSDGSGISFEAPRLPLLRAFTRRLGIRGDGFTVEAQAVEAAMRGVPDADDDLRAFVNDGAVVTASLLSDAIRHADAAGGTGGDALRARLRALAPYETSGIVGATREADHPAAAAEILAALDAVRAALPPNRHPRPLNYLRHYAREVAVPAIGAPAIPDADADALATLGGP